MKDLKDYVRSIPDFPKPGIIFRDITTLINDAEGFHQAIDDMCEKVKDIDFDVIAGAEARGFIFGAAMAYKMHKPLVLIRKKGKLPTKVIAQEYDLEYGTSRLEMHVDSYKPGTKVLIVDDLLATGGTTKAITQLVEKTGGIVAGISVLIELSELKGREHLTGFPVFSSISFEGE
ncbi:MAG: adenine phosphoribosyltransferase [Bacteroidales bacterium]|nr:adenine phosphoribosyltransferase [Bacteroidales bacterium]